MPPDLTGSLNPCSVLWSRCWQPPVGSRQLATPEMRWPRSSRRLWLLLRAVGGSLAPRSLSPELPALLPAAEPAAEPGPAAGRALSPANHLRVLLITSGC